MSIRSLIARLNGWPIISNKYRAHWRVMINTHRLILQLLEDTVDGDTRRASLAEWHRAERPVLSVLRGTTSLLRIDGPRQSMGNTEFAMGALIESPGVIAHLDQVDTLHLEARVRQAIEREVLGWIDEHELQNCLPDLPRVDRDVFDLKALRRMSDWVRRDRWTREQSYGG